MRKLRYFEPRQYVSIDYARRDVLVIQIDGSGASGVSGASEERNPVRGSSAQLAQAASEFLATGKFDPAVIQKLLASGQVPAALVMQFAAAKNDPDKIKEIAKSMTGTHDGLAPGLSFSKPEVTPGEPLRLEILSFLESVRTRQAPRVTARQGRAALELALTIQATMAAHAERAGLGGFL